jgi:hypothetical protein
LGPAKTKIRSVQACLSDGAGMNRVFPVFALAVAADWMVAISAHSGFETVERSVKAAPNKETQVGVYLNVLPDCTSGPLPTIRLVSPLTFGKVVIKTAKMKATNYKACLALKVPAYVAFYKSPSDFSGDDGLTLKLNTRADAQKFRKSLLKSSGSALRKRSKCGAEIKSFF